MKRSIQLGRERGVALAVALLFLLVVTVISVVAASNSALGVKISSNMQDAYASFQSAEAGLSALLLLVGTGEDPLDGNDSLTPFANIADDDHPLLNTKETFGSADVDVGVALFSTDTGRTCPRFELREANSNLTYDCDFYRVESEHIVPERVRSKVDLGVVKTLIGSQ